MRHRISGYKLGRDTEHRKAMFRNLAAGLIQHGQITTTLPKAKAVQPMVEKLITLARQGDLHARRRAIAILQDRKLAVVDKKTGDPIFEQYNDGRDKSLIQKLFDDIGPKYADRPGGYTRIIKLARHRIGDGGALVMLQLVGEEEGPSVKGRYSRRRRMQDNRTAYAAQLRKADGKATGEAQPDVPEADEEPVVTDAAVEIETADASAKAPADEAVAGEAADASAAAPEPSSPDPDTPDKAD